MKKIWTILILMVAGLGGSLSAQEISIPEGYMLVDTVIFRQTAAVDTALSGQSIFSLLEQSVTPVHVSQSASIRSGMDQYVAANGKRELGGYRVRIFFDNKQNARGASEEAQRRFERSHPGIPTYRSFSNPFFKVTVGDFRTRSEAMQLLQTLTGEFPSAFIVRENISFPVVDKSHAYVADTIQILRPVL